MGSLPFQGDAAPDSNCLQVGGVGTVLAGPAGLWVTMTWNVLQASVTTHVFMVLEEAI